ncbi:hypothetical protein C4D60_Mb01t08720 [Musa balbisiana]|uniref:3-deoxy-D-manno-octulosonic-acid transferase N-terminal domain-containing protein n=1 Tax=Musa balbisiana TaxID=52838 RepID=A0A4S8JKV2_MUSBA|nr:hypothetical protein C4D60_Mb01t08720 [Musa balbisiana]
MAAAHTAMALRGKIVYELYRATTHVAGPIIFAHIQWRRLRGLEHPTRWPERFGRSSSPRPSCPLLWFHAVSLGEGLAAIPMIKHCVRVQPNFVVLMTSTTTSAFEVIKDQLPDGVIYQLAPLDSPTAVGKFLGYWDPVAVFLMESELWPNLIISAAEKGIPVALLNARMSCKSFKRWSRTLALPLISLMLSKISLIAPLSTLQAVHFQLLHASPHIIHFAGDLKYGDLNVLEEDIRKIKDLQLQLASRPVWMAASIHEGEEEVMLWVHKELMKMHTDLVMILVTRHPRHGQQLALLIQEAREKISLVGQISELRTLYRITPIAVIGGSFLPCLAGHNVAEAAAAGCAVITGPYVGHFSHMLAGMLQAASSSVQQVADKAELLEALKKLLTDKKCLEAHCRAAKYAFSTVSKGVVENVWKLVCTFVLKQSIGKSDEDVGLVTGQWSFYLIQNLNYYKNDDVLASRTICRTAEMEPSTASIENTMAMVVFNQKSRPLFEGLKVMLYITDGTAKSRGRNPKAPMAALKAPKKGSIAAMRVAMAIDSDRKMSLGTMFRAEY